MPELLHKTQTMGDKEPEKKSSTEAQSNRETDPVTEHVTEHETERYTEPQPIPETEPELHGIEPEQGLEPETESETEPETEPELDRDTTPTPSENDWMDVSTESWLSEDSGTLPNVVSSISHKMPTVPASYNVPIAPSCCFFCGKDLRNTPRRMRIRHKSRCKRRHPAYYH